jgi:hypothetical protein
LFAGSGFNSFKQEPLKWLPLFAKGDENETQAPSSKKEENKTNWRNGDENETDNQKYHIQQGSRSQEET